MTKEERKAARISELTEELITLSSELNLDCMIMFDQMQGKLSGTEISRLRMCSTANIKSHTMNLLIEILSDWQRYGEIIGGFITGRIRVLSPNERPDIKIN
jgi:hypothetical protein